MTFKKKEKRINYEAIREQILAKDARKRFPVQSSDLSSLYSLPVSLGCNKETRLAMDKALKKGCAFDSFADTLVGHAYENGQYPMTSFIGYGALQQIAQNGMIRNCIKTVADDVTREWITIKGGENTPADKIERLQLVQESRWHLREVFNQAVAKVGFMGGAFIHIRTETETGDEPDLSLPLRITNECAELDKDSSLRFIVVDPVNVSPLGYNTSDPLRPDYFKPDSWFVLGKKVHATRLLPLYANEPPLLLKPAYNFLGIPQAQILWDYVLHWNVCRVASQEMVKKISLMIYYTNAQERMASMNGVQELDVVMQMLQHYRDNNSIFLANNETDRVENVQTSIGGVVEVVRQAQEMIAAINRTPAVKLFGISPSGFNATGESDIRNYNDHVRSQQELYRPALMKCLKAIQLVLWGEIDPSITFEWNELDLDNDSAQAATFGTRASALSGLVGANVMSPDEVRDALKMEKSSHLDFLSGDAPEPQGMAGMLGGMGVQPPQEGAQPEGGDAEGSDEFIEKLKAQYGLNGLGEEKNGEQQTEGGKGGTA